MADFILAFQDLSLHSSEGRLLFSSLNWSLPRGERLALRTEPGSAGTLLLNLAAGLIQPEEGSVLLDGVPLHPYAFDHPFIKRGAVGWLPRDGGLIQNLSLLANATLPLRFVKGMRPKDAEELAMGLLTQVGLEGLAEQRPHTLEARERWLGALVRAALMEPELWLVDRPPGDMDATTEEIAARLLASSLAKASTSALVVWDEWERLLQPTQFVKLAGGHILPEG
jgi:predicted ABC-type transport system involved in lysophospholipase L1 biosynthesis ATPase subunit